MTCAQILTKSTIANYLLQVHIYLCINKVIYIYIYSCLLVVVRFVLVAQKNVLCPLF